MGEYIDGSPIVNGINLSTIESDMDWFSANSKLKDTVERCKSGSILPIFTVAYVLISLLLIAVFVIIPAVMSDIRDTFNSVVIVLFLIVTNVVLIIASIRRVKFDSYVKNNQERLFCGIIIGFVEYSKHTGDGESMVTYGRAIAYKDVGSWYYMKTTDCFNKDDYVLGDIIQLIKYNGTVTYVTQKGICREYSTFDN